MALFDMFGKRKGASLPQLCYDIAYFILPHYAHAEYEKVRRMCEETLTSAGPFFYVMACHMRKVEPDIDAAKSLKWHAGQLKDGRQHLTLEYPVPPAVNMENMTPEELANQREPVVLAPHFSCMVRNSDDTSTYYVLGQAPIGGGTTLRCVTADGANCNLGPGPSPSLEAFLTCINDTGTGARRGRG